MMYVRDVDASLAFYEAVLGVERLHIDEDGSYGDLEVGSTGLGFVAEWHADRHLDTSFRRNTPGEAPAGFELYFVVDDLDEAFARAIDAGAIVVMEPTGRPWGGRAAIVRDPDGILVELSSEPT
jgi:lactoylglutathione lyase